MRHSAAQTGRAVSLAATVAITMLFVPSAVPSAHASEVSESATVPPSDTDFVRLVDVLQFDQSAGRLTSVTVELVAEVAGGVVVENVSMSSGATGSAIVSADVAAASTANPTVAVSVAVPKVSKPFGLTVFDGAIDFEGESGAAFDDFQAAEATSVTFSAPDEIAPFIGDGVVPFEVVASATSEALASGGNIEFAFTTLAGATVNVTYQFDVPMIDVEKTPDAQTVGFGADATFSITVTNTGESDLINVFATDAATPDCDRSVGDLAVGATVTYECVSAGVVEDFTNVVVAEGEDSIGNVVTDEDDAVVDVIAPQIDIEKTPDTQVVTVGADAPFDIVVTNVGDVDLFNVVVTDALTPSCDATIGDLAIGASVTYSCAAEGVTFDFTNTAVVVGEDEVGNAVRDEDDAVVDVLAPEIRILKTPDDQTVVVGRDVTFDIEVQNTGDVDLFNTVVTDPLTPSCDAAIGDLAIGETTTYQCTAAAVIEPFTNVATVVAEDDEGNSVTDVAQAIVRVVEPSTGQPELPATGSDSFELSLAGVFMVMFGAALLHAERRRAGGRS